jgi:hypothetical protein
LPNGASKSSSEEIQGLHRWLKIRRHQEAPISKVIWRLGEWSHRNWRTRVVSRNFCNHIVIKHYHFSGGPRWRRFPSRRVDVARSEDERTNYYKSQCLLSSLSFLILINGVFEPWKIASVEIVWSGFKPLNLNLLFEFASSYFTIRSDLVSIHCQFIKHLHNCVH